MSDKSHDILKELNLIPRKTPEENRQEMVDLMRQVIPEFVATQAYPLHFITIDEVMEFKGHDAFHDFEIVELDAEFGEQIAQIAPYAVSCRDKASWGVSLLTSNIFENEIELTGNAFVEYRWENISSEDRMTLRFEFEDDAVLARLNLRESARDDV